MRRPPVPFCLLILFGATVLFQGCATPYGKAIREFRGAPSCCGTMAELPTEPLVIGKKTSFTLEGGAPVFGFLTGKSYFRLFTLPAGPYPFRVTVTSYLMGDQPKSAYLFYPQLVTLDGDRRVVRTVGPESFTMEGAGLIETLRETGGLRHKLEGGITFTGEDRKERFLLVLTTDALLREKSVVSVGGEVPMFMFGFKELKKEGVPIPHAPFGRLAVTVASLGTLPPPPPVPVAPTAAAPAAGTGAPLVIDRQGGVVVEKGETLVVGAAIDRPATTGAPSAGTAAAPAPLVVGPQGVVVGKGETLTVGAAQAPLPFAVKVRTGNGVVIGRVEPGRSSLAACRTLFESAGIGLGQERENSAPFTVGTATLIPRRLVAPPGTPHQLYFDANDTLVLFMDGAPADLPATGGAFRLRYPDAREAGRTLGSYELQVSLDPCVTLVAAFRTVGDTLDSAAYAYVCGAK